MKYVDRVTANLKGCEAASTGICPGCDECREADPRFRVRDLDFLTEAEDEPQAYGFSYDKGARYASEEEAEAASRAAFDEAVRNGHAYDEPSFSWSPCGICGSRLGGDREAWHYVHAGKLYHNGDACTDCVLYLANGDAPEEEPEEDEDA